MKLHTLWITAGAAVLTTAMLTGGAIAASADSLSPAPASSNRCTVGQHLVELWKDLPAKLRSDLRDLKAAAPADRPGLAKDIRRGALDGTYGSGVQKRAERVQGRVFAGDRGTTVQDAAKRIRSSDFWQDCVAG